MARVRGISAAPTTACNAGARPPPTSEGEGGEGAETRSSTLFSSLSISSVSTSDFYNSTGGVVGVATAGSMAVVKRWHNPYAALASLPTPAPPAIGGDSHPTPSPRPRAAAAQRATSLSAVEKKLINSAPRSYHQQRHGSIFVSLTLAPISSLASLTHHRARSRADPATGRGRWRPSVATPQPPLPSLPRRELNPSRCRRRRERVCWGIVCGCQLLGAAFMGNIVNTVNKFSGNNADGVPFRRCSYLPNSTCDENGSSVTGKSASAINGSINGHGTLYKDVGNEEIHLATDSTSKPGCRGDTNHCTNKERETRNVIVHTDSRQNGDATNSDNAVLICNQTAGHMSYGLDGESNRSSGSLAAVVSEVLVSKAPLEKRCRTNLEETGDLENTPNAHVSKRSRLHRVSPANSLFDREACDDLIDSAHNLDCSRTPNASVHDETVPNEDKTPTSLDVRGCEGTPRASLKRRVNKKRTKREASYPTTPLNGKTGALVVIQPPLTRTRAKGRLIVPRLDPGSQNIIYDMGLIRSHLLRGGKRLVPRTQKIAAILMVNIW
uniref:Uncharacterized protein n=1 Tax=Oryza meridionalis TaxID=40149 RepID=A0A0E0DCR3_9ORYZ